MKSFESIESRDGPKRLSSELLISPLRFTKQNFLYLTWRLHLTFTDPWKCSYCSVITKLIEVHMKVIKITPGGLKGQFKTFVVATGVENSSFGQLECRGFYGCFHSICMFRTISAAPTACHIITSMSLSLEIPSLDVFYF